MGLNNEAEAAVTSPTFQQLMQPQGSFNVAADPELLAKAPKPKAKKPLSAEQQTAKLAAEFKRKVDELNAKREQKEAAINASVPDAANNPNLKGDINEALRPKTAEDKLNELIKKRTMGGKLSLAGSANNLIDADQNTQAILNVSDAMKALGIGAFDEKHVVPELESIRAEYADELKKQQGRKDNTIDILSTLAAIGKDPTKTDISGFYKYDAPERIAQLRDKMKGLLTDESKLVGDKEKLAGTLYGAQRLPNTNYSVGAAQSFPPVAGRGRPISPGDLTKVGEASAKLDALHETRNLVGELLPKADLNTLRLYGLNPTGASAYNAVLGSPDTERLVSTLADLVLKYQLSVSGKAATDQEQAKILIASGIAAGATRGGVKEGVDKLINDFAKQIALPIKGQKPELLSAYEQNSGDPVRTKLQRAVDYAKETAKKSSLTDAEAAELKALEAKYGKGN